MQKIVREKLTAMVNFFKKNTQSQLSQPVDTEEKTTVSHNPYLEARTEWNYRYNDILISKQNWQWTASAMILLNLLLIMSLSYTALQSKYVPYVVTIDAQNNANFGGLLSQTSGKASPAIVNAFIRRYIENARAIIIDPVAQKQSLAYVYAVSRGEALAFLNSYYPLHDPFTVAKKGTVEVQVQPSLQKSAQTWQTQWTEITRDLNGVILHQAHYEALVTVGQYPFKDETEMNINPLGLYVTHISWSQQL